MLIETVTVAALVVLNMYMYRTFKTTMRQAQETMEAGLWSTQHTLDVLKMQHRHILELHDYISRLRTMRDDPVEPPPEPMQPVADGTVSDYCG